MDIRPQRILLSSPIKEAICSNLTFKDVVNLKKALNFPSLKCKIFITDPDSQIFFLNRVDETAILVYNTIQKHGSK